MQHPLRAAVRADASAHIGHGHVMRCLALAGGLREQGVQVQFLQRPRAGDASAAIVAAGFALTPLHPSGSTEADDALASAALLQPQGGVDLLVVDHYQLGAAWVQRLRPWARRVLVIDDLANRALEGDLLLEPNWHDDPAARYRGLWPAGTPLLLGTAYALLRPDFAAERALLQGDDLARDGHLGRVLVAFGGGDPPDATGACTAALHAAFPALTLDVVVGSGSPHGAALRQTYAGSPVVQVSIGVTDMARRMAQASLFVGAGGSMTWERACLGLPGITLPIADNQLDGCARLAAAGEGIDLGPYTVASLPALVAQVRSLLADPARVRAMGAALAQRCDGLGVQRVVAAALAGLAGG
jgi:UDP-2,4-diacetamido-2,4,6-trideoxy-beta-L-altropyranose hydrolase